MNDNLLGVFMAPLVHAVNNIPLTPGIIVGLFLGMVCGDDQVGQWVPAIEGLLDVVRMTAVSLSIMLGVTAVCKLFAVRTTIQPALLIFAIAASVFAIVITGTKKLGVAEFDLSYAGLITFSMSALVCVIRELALRYYRHRGGHNDKPKATT